MYNPTIEMFVKDNLHNVLLSIALLQGQKILHLFIMLIWNNMLCTQHLCN